MKRSLHTLTLIGIGSLSLSLVGVGIAAYWNFLHYSDRMRWVEHTYKVIDVSETLLSDLKDAETGQRGYLLTLDPAYLEPFHQAKPSIHTALGLLKQLTQDNPAQQQSIKRLEILVQQKLQELQQTTQLAKRRKAQAALKIVRLSQGKAWMDEIRQLTAMLEQRERLLLNHRIGLKQLAATQITLMLGFAALAIALLIALLVLLYWSITEHQRILKQNLAEIARSRETLHKILERITDAFFSVDQNWNFVYVNPKLGELSERSPESLIGKNFWEEFPEIEQPFALAYRRAMQEQRQSLIENYHVRLDKWFECRIFPSLDGLSVFVQDTTERHQLASAIAESERKFRAIFNYTFEYITLLTPDGIVLNMNYGPLDFMQVNYEAVQGKPFWELSLWGNNPAVQQQIETAVAEAAQGQFIRYDIPDLKNYWDDLRTFDFSLKPIFEDDATVIYLVAEGRDITDLKRTDVELQHYREHLEALVEQRTTELMEVNLQLQQELIERQRTETALALSERQYRTLTENSADLIIRHDRALNFLYVNPALEALTGAPAQDWIDKNMTDMGFPDDIAQQISDACEAVFKTGKIGMLEHKAPSPHGWLTFQSLIAPEFDDRHVVESVLISARDITAVKEREAAIQEADRRWRYLLDNVRLVVVGLNLRGEVDYVNAYCLKLTGYRADEVLGKPWFETFLPPAQQQAVREAFQELIDLEFHPYYQNPIVTKAGEERMIAWNNTQLRNSQGEVTGSMSIGEDITERFALERMKAEFISVVSHELRTPITSIQGALNLLSEGIVPVDSSRGHEVLSIAADGADRLVNIVNDILDLERLESGRITLMIVPCQAADLMVQASKLMKVLADRADVTLNITPQPFRLMGDGDRLIQVMTNLLSNAIKFSPKGSKILFGVEQDSAREMLQFWVQDEGRGIPPEQLERIFERFHQVNASDARQKGGTGLGLPICRSIIQQHGGTIWAESVLAQGSRICFTVPAKSIEPIEKP
jgi:PAS domain S-box-containing protein